MMVLLALIGYTLVLIAFSLYSLYAIHHLNEYGYSGVASQLALKIYVGYSSVVVILSMIGILAGVLT